jgi:hypothetical protein
MLKIAEKFASAQPIFWACSVHYNITSTKRGMVTYVPVLS